jgi:hypothetical protein
MLAGIHTLTSFFRKDLTLVDSHMVDYDLSPRDPRGVLEKISSLSSLEGSSLVLMR